MPCWAGVIRDVALRNFICCCETELCWGSFSVHERALWRQANKVDFSTGVLLTVPPLLRSSSLKKDSAKLEMKSETFV